MIECKDTGMKEFILELQKRGHKIKVQKEYNKGRHRLIITDKAKYYAVYKREWFNTFGIQFPDFIAKFPMFKGKGDSINSNSLEIAIHNDVNQIVFIHKEG